MSKRDFISSFSVVPSGRSFTPGTVRSRLCPPDGVQPKSLPDPDHHACVLLAFSPVSKSASVISLRPGSLATYISEFCTRAPLGLSVSV